MNTEVRQPAGTSLISVENARLPISPKFASDLGVSSTQWRVLIDQIFPAAKTVEAVVMAVTYCKARNLDVMKKPVHIVPMWSSARSAMVETVWPGIAEIRTTAARTGEYAGMDEMQWGPMREVTFSDTVERWVKVEGQRQKQKKPVEITKTVRYPEWGSVVVYRLVQGVRYAFHTKIYWTETYARLGNDTDVPNDMWAKRPIGQFDKCLEAAALRRAFPEEVGSMYAAEEMEGQVIEHAAAEEAKPEKPNKPSAPAAPKKPEAPAKPNTPAASTAPTKPADPEPEDVIDAEYEIVEEGGEGDTQVEREPKEPGDLLNEIESDLAVAMDEETIEEVWNQHDVKATFESIPNGDSFVSVAETIKARHLKRVGKSNGQKK